MPKFTITLLVEPGAPVKPNWGAPCNGCGVCCLAEPCPLGVLLSGRRHGRCSALRWHAVGQRYRCGALSEPVGVLRIGYLPLPSWAQAALAKWLSRLAYRWVSAGSGCDCSMDVSSHVSALGRESREQGSED